MPLTTANSHLNLTGRFGYSAGWYKWEMLVVLWIAFFLHQGCRQIYNSLIPLIRLDLGLTNVQAGLVSSIFTLVYGVFVPVAGLAGDRLSRKWIIVFSLLVFGGGTLLAGFSTSFITLVLFISIATAGGEAFFYPSTTSLLAQFHEKNRALALGILQTGTYFGITTSGLLAGWIGQNHGWRTAFLVFGIAGILWMMVVALRLRNTPLPAPDPGQTPQTTLRASVSYLVRRPSVWLLSVAFGAMVFVNVGFLTWMPSLLHERFNLSLAVAAFYSMFYHFLGAFLGVLIGSRIADQFAARFPSIRMGMNAIGLLLGAPFIYWLGHSTTSTGTYCTLFLFGLFRGFYDSNLFASLYDVVEPRVRSSATGLMLAFAFAFGSSAPALLGWMKSTIGLGIGISYLCGAYLFGGACILLVLKFFRQRDWAPGSNILTVP